LSPLRSANGSDAGSDPFGLVVDADAVRHPGDVVEVGDDLDCVRDRRIVEVVDAQRVDVRRADLSSAVGQLDREVAEGALAGRQIGLLVVVLRVPRKLVVCALGTEVVRVGARSVVAALLG
jgi:hypothetical protein